MEISDDVIANSNVEATKLLLNDQRVDINWMNSCGLIDSVTKGAREHTGYYCVKMQEKIRKKIEKKAQKERG